MLVRTELIIKWALYTAAGLLCIFVQTVLLNHISLWGTIPFIYPLISSVLATMEGPAAGSVYALILGVFCDSLLPSPIPCFFTLVLPPAALLGGQLSRHLLPRGLFCSLAASLISFFMTLAFHAVVLWARNQAAWAAAAVVGLRECLVSVPLILLVTPLFDLIYRRVHWDD